MSGADRTRILKRDALGRVAMPKEKREGLLDEFERSGLKGAQFARAAGIRYSTFAYWVQQRRHARGDYQDKLRPGDSRQTSSLRLVEAVVAGSPAAQPGMTPALAPLEVVLPGGARMLLATTHQAALAAQLIKALAASSSC